MSRGWVCPGGGYAQGMVMSRGVSMCRGEWVCLVGTWDQGVGTNSMLLTPSGSHHLYSQHVVGTHPT